MSNFIHRWLNPHCRHCMDEKTEKMVCPSCEILKQQVELFVYQNKQLLDRLINPVVPASAPEPFREVSVPKNVSWNIKRQMLEAEDRERARLMREAPIPTKDLEKELDIATAQREMGK